MKQQKERNDYENTTYGASRIDSTQFFEYRWTLKIDKDFSNFITVGISSNNEPNRDYSAWREGSIVTSVLHEYFHYAYNGYYGYSSSSDGPSQSPYGEPFGGGDVIDIRLILGSEQRQVIFYKNGKCQGVAFENIEIGNEIKYRLAISVSDSTAPIHMTRFVKQSTE